MSFPIDFNIPAANNDPADDQPLMQLNFSNINDYLQVDHTDPASSIAGIHDQVTLIGQGTAGPGIGNGIGAIFASNQIAVPIGTAFPFWQNANAIFPFVLGNNDITTIFNQNGVVSLGGITFQWGLATVTANATSTVTFNRPFTTVYNVQMSPIKSGSGTDDAWIKAPATNTNFQVNNNSSSITQVYWSAIGQ